MISAKNISFSYNQNTPIFDDFSVDLDGYFTGLIGLNGAGKSTFLQLCLGLRFLERGEIMINGYSVEKERMKVLKQIGILHENPQFPSWTNVSTYLVWVGTIRGLSYSQANEQTNFLLKKLGLTEKRDEMVNRMSAGQKQRFGIAQAIIGVPKIIFLDEPTANLDVQSRNMVLEFLKEIVDTFDTRIVIMSHILSDLERFCDTIAILHEGNIKYQSSINDLIKNEFIREYVIRGIDLSEISEIFDKNNISIIRRADYELIVKMHTPDELEKLRKIIPRGYSITPHRSVLEQKFIEITGGNNI